MTGGNETRARTAISRRRALISLGGVSLGGLSLALSACSPSFGPSSGPSGGQFGGSGYPLQPTGPYVNGDTIGTGSVRVGLLLPKTAPGNGPALALAMQNAATLGLNDFNGNDLTVLVKDSLGTPEGAAAAAQAAISDGAQLILGPVFAAEVSGAGPVARQAGVPVIAFSSDPAVAAPGVFLLGFLVEGQVERILAEASKAGRKSIAAIISQSAYGNLAEASLRQSAGRYGIRVVDVERFPAGNPASAVASVARFSSQIDCIFIPEGQNVAPQVAGALRSSGVDLNRIKLLGTGVWNDRSVYGNPALAGGWFPSPEISGFSDFAGRYRAAYGSEPPLTASLAYDAVVLAAGLVKMAGAQPFQLSVLTNPEGFLSSVNGLFRLNANGTNDRGLAVYEVTGTNPSLVSPAPRAFTGS